MSTSMVQFVCLIKPPEINSLNRIPQISGLYRLSGAFTKDRGNV